MKSPRTLLFVSLMFLPFTVWILDAEPQMSDASTEYLTYQFELSKELTGHKGSVHSVVFSRDGSLIASGSEDGTAKLWNADSGQQIRALMRHPHPILCVSLSPDSNILASGSEAGKITLWDVNYKERIRILKGHEDRVWSIRFSPDGTFLASGSADKTIRLWNMRSGKEIRTFRGHTDSIYSLSFSPDGGILASGSADGTVKIRDIDSGRDISTLKENTGAVNSICFSPDGKTLASGLENGTIRLWNVESGTETGTLSGHKGAIGINDCLSFSPDGRILVSGASDGKIRVWEVGSGNMIKELDAYTAVVNSVAFNAAGRQIVSAGLDGAVRLWKIRVTESLGVTLDAEYKGWQSGILKLKADVLGLADAVKFQYSLDGSTWLDIVEKSAPPYSADWNTRLSIPDLAPAVRLRVVAERATGARSIDVVDGSFAVDNEPPSTEHDYDGLWHKADFDINLSADDGNGTGVSAIGYTLNYGEQKSTKGNGQPKITKEGINNLEYWSVDKLGNEESHKVLSDIKLDKTAPVFLDWVKESKDTSEGFAGPFRVSVRALDEGGSGLAGKVPQFDYHIDSGTAYD